MARKKPGDRDDIALSSYSPPPLKVENPAGQITHKKYLGHGAISRVAEHRKGK